ncbi:MAG: prolipoprotein diacylglyceryl transferase [Clostridia bacterium]
MDPFNTINFTVFDIPGYFFFALLGLIITISVFVILVTIKRYSIKTNMIILFISLIAMFIFAKLFGCISGIYRDIGLGVDVTWDSIMNTGIVFYGGLIGLLLSYLICSKISKQDQHILDVVAVCIPLFHAITRIGCFVGGCCFGVESQSDISINYTTIIFGEVVTTYRIPTQLIESCFNFSLFLYLLVLYSKDDWQRKKILRRYLLIYSIGRFLIEFWRGDAVRGVICGVSFSQVISILIWIYLISTYIHSKSNVEEGLAL